MKFFARNISQLISTVLAKVAAIQGRRQTRILTYRNISANCEPRLPGGRPQFAMAYQWFMYKFGHVYRADRQEQTATAPAW